MARRDPVPLSAPTKALAAAWTSAVAFSAGIEADSSSTRTTFMPQRSGSGGLNPGSFTCIATGNVPLLFVAQVVLPNAWTSRVSAPVPEKRGSGPRAKVLERRVVLLTDTHDEKLPLEPIRHRIPVTEVESALVNVILLLNRIEPGGPDWFGLSEAPVTRADATAGTAAINTATAATPQTSRPARRKPRRSNSTAERVIRTSALKCCARSVVRPVPAARAGPERAHL